RGRAQAVPRRPLEPRLAAPLDGSARPCGARGGPREARRRHRAQPARGDDVRRRPGGAARRSGPALRRHRRRHARAPHAPTTRTRLWALVAAGATLPLLAGAAGRDARRGIVVLAALLLAGELRQLLPPLAPTARLLLLAEDAGGGLWLALALRGRAASTSPERAALVLGRVTLA